jgi:hypothetical protein
LGEIGSRGTFRCGLQLIPVERADRSLKLAWPSAIRPIELRDEPIELIGAARAPPIKLNRADPLRASLPSVGWHGNLH